MVSPSVPVSEEPKRKKIQHLFRFSKYAVLSLIVNGGILYSATQYLANTPPIYTSEMVVNVSSGAGNVNLSLPSIGQAVSSSKTNFSSHSDPRDNYKVLLGGKSVKLKAAKMLGIPAKDLAMPRAGAISNTTTMKIEMNSTSPQMARKQVIAYYDALYERLNELRLDEQIEKNKSIQKALLAAKEKLASEQSRVSQYKLESGLNSSDQIKNLITNIESIRSKRSQLIAERSQVNDELESLSRNLKMTPSQAAEALNLQTDQQLTESYGVYSSAIGELNALVKARGPNYPDVVKLKGKSSSALADSLARAKVILGREIAERELEIYLLNNGASPSTPRGSLFQMLVEKDAVLRGIDGELVSLQEQIKILEARLSALTQKEAILSNYLRELDIAEAVFAATLAKIDLGRGDIFAAYPLIQIFEDATLPIKQSAPQPALVMAGALIACISFTLALTLGWYRKECLNISKKLISNIAA